MAGELTRVLERLRGKVREDGAERYEEQLYRKRVAGLRLPTTLERAMLTGCDEHGNTLAETDAEKRLRASLAAGKRLIVLQGPPGTGKTYAAVRALTDAEKGRWVSSLEFCRMADWDPGVDGYRYTPTLGIDDLGIEAQRSRGKVEALLYDRHAEGKTTIATTNLPVKEFKAAYNARILSRLKEVGAWIACKQVVRPGEKK